MRTRQIASLGDFDKRANLDDMKRYKSKDIVKFIEKDLEYGLTREEVDFYSNKKYSFEKMKLISNAFKRGCSIEDIIIEDIIIEDKQEESILNNEIIEESMNNEEDLNKKKQTLKDISALESKKVE